MEHSGTLNGGHYVAYVRRCSGADARWFYASDSMVRPTDLQSVLAAEAYLLFYERNAPFELGAPQRAPGAAAAEANCNGNGHAAGENGNSSEGASTSGAAAATDGAAAAGGGAADEESAASEPKKGDEDDIAKNGAELVVAGGADEVGPEESLHGGQRR